MNILLTNDDSVKSEGILKLAEVLRSRGRHRVYVIAPDTDRSGVSHGISLINSPVKLVRLEEDTWSCSGYPVDCVIAAMLGALPVKPDLALSGINRGANIGTDIIYSATAAGARQAGLMGVPAVALSLAGKSPFCWDMAAFWSADHLEELAAFWRKETFVNVNIPNSPGGPEGMKFAWPAVRRYNDKIKVIDAPDGNRWCFMESGGAMPVDEAGSDFDVVSRNFAAVSSVYIYPAVRKDLSPGAPEHTTVLPRRAEKE